MGRNYLYLYNSGIKYKRCCESNTVEVYSNEKLTLEQIKNKVSVEYYDFLDIFNRAEAEKLPFYRPYNHVLKFINKNSKTKLSKS